MSTEATFLIGFAMIIAMKIVVFILGYLTIRMGYKLISSGVEGKFKFAAEIGGVKADLASMSPGLLFVLLGVMLIGIAVYVDKPIKAKGNSKEVGSITNEIHESRPNTAPPPLTLTIEDSSENDDK